MVVATDQANRRKRPDPTSMVTSTESFSSGRDVRQALNTNDPDELVKALTSLRAQIGLRTTETTLNTSDERVIFVQQWLEDDENAASLFEVWNRTGPRQTNILSPLVSVLANLLHLFSAQQSFHNLGTPIIHRILTTQCAHRLNSYLSGTHSELILISLKLWNVMSDFASGNERKSVLDAFAWEAKTLPKLLFMRRKGKGSDPATALVKPDIRTLYMLFVLSFLGTTTPGAIKSNFIERHGDAIKSIFKGLSQDPYPVVRHVLELCWTGLWSDVKVKRTLKIQLFNEAIVTHIMKLYSRDEPEDDAQEHIPADVAHHFLLAICTRPGIGLCFKDRGWYPRTSEDDTGSNQAEDEEPKKETTGRIYNKILANVLRGLRPNEDGRQQELVLKILAACPELVAGFWRTAGLTMEPRLSSRWLANIALFSTIVSLPVPVDSFLDLGKTSQHQAVPPPLHTIIENILPSVGTKAHMTKGLQSTSSLVKHATGLGLAKCLYKLDATIRALKDVERALDENDDTGWWSLRRQEVEMEAARRVPDFQVIVGLVQQHQKSTGMNQTTNAMLSEVGQRLLGLYHMLLPILVAGNRFDAGKLLQQFTEESNVSADESGDAEVSKSGMQILRRLHAIRLLGEAEYLNLSAKTSSSARTNMHVLLSQYIKATVPAIKLGLGAIIQKQLGETLLFQHDPSEMESWLRALNFAARFKFPGEGDEMNEGSEILVDFLDDCVQRSLKTPHRYLDECQRLLKSVSTDTPITLGQPGTGSPLLVTIVEQLEAKINGKHIRAFGVLFVVYFIRQLFYVLVTSAAGLPLGVLRGLARRVADVTARTNSTPLSPNLERAIQREVEALGTILRLFKDGPSDAWPIPSVNRPTDSTATIAQFKSGASAWEVISWIMSEDPVLSQSDLVDMINVILSQDAKLLPHLLFALRPEEGLLWKLLISDNVDHLPLKLDYPWLLLQADDVSLQQQSHRHRLIDRTIELGTSLKDAQSIIHAILLRVTASFTSSSQLKHLISLLCETLQRMNTLIRHEEVVSLKRMVFEGSHLIRQMCLDPQPSAVTVSAIQILVERCLNPHHESDVFLARPIADQWMSTLSLDNDANDHYLRGRLLWGPFATPTMRLTMLEHLRVGISTRLSSQDVLKLLLILQGALSSELSDTERARISEALSHARQEYSSEVDVASVIDDILVALEGGSLPLGHDGLPFPNAIFASLPSMCRDALSRWKRRKEHTSTLIDTPEVSDTLSDRQCQLLAYRIYHEQGMSENIATRLRSGSIALPRSGGSAHILMHALCDLSNAKGRTLYIGDYASVAFKSAAQMMANHKLLIEERQRAYSCAKGLLQACPDSWDVFTTSFSKAVGKTPVDRLTLQTIILASYIVATNPSEGKSAIAPVVEHALHWIVRYYAEDLPQTEELIACIDALASLVTKLGSVKAHLVEPILEAVIQYRMHQAQALHIALAIVRVTSLKPVVVNRYIQNLLQQVQTVDFARKPSRVQELTAELLYELFASHPMNTCQPSHIEPILTLYRGTLSTCDLHLLSIFQLFESQRAASTGTLISRWSSAAGLNQSASPLRAVQSLDSTMTFRTCLSFPRTRQLTGYRRRSRNDEGQSVYDPVFVMLLLSRALQVEPPSSATGWVELFRTNVVSLLIAALAAKHAELREVAVNLLATLRATLESADLQEKPLVVHLLNLVKGLYPSTPDTSSNRVPRVPSYTILLLVHALRGVFYPSNFIYPLTARFLLQRPSLDPTDVPMLFSMLYNSDDDWKKERTWILRLLIDGMTCARDWKVFRRRHTWDLVATFFQISGEDRALRQATLDLLLNITSIPEAATSIVHKSGLLPWMEAQLQVVKAEETKSWLSIIQNLLITTDPIKMERGTVGSWANGLARCVLMLVKSSGGPELLETFADIILRLSTWTNKPHVEDLLHQALRLLWNLEDSIQAPVRFDCSAYHTSRVEVSSLPHRASYARNNREAPASTIYTWGQIVEVLWQASMQSTICSSAWDALSAKMLLWRVIVGDHAGEPSEWMRRQVVCMMSGTT